MPYRSYQTFERYVMGYQPSPGTLVFYIEIYPGRYNIGGKSMECPTIVTEPRVKYPDGRLVILYQTQS